MFDIEECGRKWKSFTEAEWQALLTESPEIFEELSIDDWEKLFKEYPDIPIYFDNEDYNSLIEPLKEIISTNDVSCLVLGLPKNMDNSLGIRAHITLEFKKLLEKCKQYRSFEGMSSTHTQSKDGNTY